MPPARRTSKDRIAFTGTVEKFEGPYAWSYVEFPHDVQELFGRKGTVRVLGTVNGVAMDRALMPTKSGIHVIVLGAELRKRAKVKVGDTVSIVLWKNPTPDVLELPEALVDTFDLLPEFKAKWEALRPGMKRSILIWLNSAKTAPTLAARIAEVLRRSGSGHAWFGKGNG